MLRGIFFSLALGLAANCAIAQTAPSPADVGISKGTPDVFKLKGSDNFWTPFGSVDSSTHIFAPATNGSIAPGDCLKWGPGFTSAGAACNSVTGGATPANQLTIYTSHAGLVANVTTPTQAWTVLQQGFYAPGDGGGATYQWSLTSYCQGGTSGSPTPADGIVCVLPIGQSASTAGRYLLQTGNGIDVRQIGMVSDGITDNYPLVATLMNAISSVGNITSGMDVFFPAIAGKPYANGNLYTDYYFSKSFRISRRMNIRCQGIPNGGGDASTRLVFPAGVHGVIFDNALTSVDNNYGGGGMTGCGVIGRGFYLGGSASSGATTITGVSASRYGGTFDFVAGDGVIVYDDFQPANGAPAVAPGAYISGTSGTGPHTLTLASPYTINATINTNLWRLPAADKFTIQSTSGSPTITVTAGPFLLTPGDYIWSDAFPFGTVVKEVSGTAFPLTVKMAPYKLNGPDTENATATRSPGQMWVIPAGIKTFVQTSLRQNFLATFGFGLEMECSAWSTPGPMGCNASVAQENIFFYNIIGRLAIGDGTGASSSIANVYSYNSFADIAEAGSVGSVYLGDNSNSAEAGTSLYGVVGLCQSQNGTIFVGMYAATLGGYCMTGIGSAPNAGGTNVFLGNQNVAPTNAPALGNNTFTGAWFFNNSDASSEQLCVNGGVSYLLAFSSGNGSCTGFGTFELYYDAAHFIWGLEYYGGAGGNPLRLTTGTTGGYTGYLGENAGYYSYPMFTQGFLLYDTEGGYTATTWTPGAERLVDGGLGIPAGTYHKHGDIHFNQSAVIGSPVGWVDVADGANFKPFGVISSFSGTKNVGACVFTIVNGIITNITGC